jgi:ATP-dependent Lhr-like helicase
MLEESSPAEIKRRLKHTWIPFFSRFARFTPIQELTIPYILDGKNVVVISPAASGKTEAVIAPIIETMLERNRNEIAHGTLRILYISPTRALVNDLFRRLVDPILYVNIAIGRKTGDRPRLDLKTLPTVLLTTPESFDSLLTRQPQIFKSLEAVVLDELHLLDNNPRGDQLRVLLQRLRKINEPLQYAALSATIDDLTIGGRYFKNAHVCFLKSARTIENTMVTDQEFLTRMRSIVAERKIKKVLIFFNARSLAELYSQKLDQPSFEGAVFVHHASLSKQRREEVERHMNSSDRAILCATSTLELGIDIGDVDCIVLYRPPFDISSLLQRIGRGNRRTDSLFSICVYTDEWERLLFTTFFECAAHGRLCAKKYKPSLSVIPQQTYSYLHQRRRIGTTLRSLKRILMPVYTDEQVRTVFKYLVEEGHVQETRPGIYYNTEKLEKKIDWGTIHSNIAAVSFGEYEVVDVSTSLVRGRVFHLRQRFILGGRCWETVRIDEREKKVYARNIGNVPAIAQVFEGKGAGNYNFTLALDLKKRIFPECAVMDFPCACDKTHVYILHLFGSLYGFLLADALFEEHIDALDVEGKMLILNHYHLNDTEFPVPNADSFRTIIGRNIAKLEDALGSGAFFYDLPPAYQVEDHYLGLDIDGFRDFLQSIRLATVELEYFQNTAKRLRK